MAGAANKGSSKGGGGKARSVGAAASGGMPNGAILNDNDAEIQQKQRFKAWAKGFRDSKLKPNAKLEMCYDKSPAPPKGN